MESESKILSDWRSPVRELLGPLFLLISLSLALLKGATFSFPLFLLTTLGLVASLLFAMRGALTFCALMLGYFLLFRSHLPAGTQLWHFGFFTTLALAFVITALSLNNEGDEEESEPVDQASANLTIQLENRLKLSQEKIERMTALVKESDLQVQSLYRENEELKLESVQQRRQIEFLKREVESSISFEEPKEPSAFEELYKLNDNLKTMLEEKESALKKVTNELSLAQHELKLVSTRERGLFAEISSDNLLRLEKERDALLKTVEALEYECQTLSEKMGDEPPDFQDLKWQLEEKKEILHQTRAELFRAESDYLTYQRLLGAEESDSSLAMSKLTNLIHEEPQSALLFDDLMEVSGETSD